MNIETATSVQLSWIPPPTASWNGVILNYTIFVEYVEPVLPTNSSDIPFNHSFIAVHPTPDKPFSNNPDPHLVSLPLVYESTVVEGLQEFQVYQFSVVMVNAAGQSDTSMPIIQELPGSGKLKTNNYCNCSCHPTSCLSSTIVCCNKNKM